MNAVARAACGWLLLATCHCSGSSAGATNSGNPSNASASPPTLPSSCQARVGEGDAALLDDFEDGDLLLDTQAQFQGLWYVNNDGTGVQSPSAGADGSASSLLQSPGSPESPRTALHTNGSDFTLWGAFAAARLNAARSRACVFDISGYTGVSLSVKGVGGLRMNMGTVATTPVEDGGECHSDACSDYGQDVALTSDWQSVSISFDQLSQPSWASSADWDPARALRVSFWAKGGEFDFWVDDLQFYR